MSYFLFQITEDGEARFEELTEAELTERVADESGEGYIEPLTEHNFWQACPGGDPMYWGWHQAGPGDKRYLLIKGEVVVPKEATRVKTWELP